MVAQPSYMLTTVQPLALASSNALSATRTLHVAVLGTLLGLRIFREFSGLIT